MAEGSRMTVTTSFVADTTTPVRAYAALRKSGGNAASFLLESVVGGERWGRYSILGIRPTRELSLMPSGEWLDAAGQPAFPGPAGGDPLAAIQSLFERASDVEVEPANPATRFSRASSSTSVGTSSP